jgi:hypothetical protein
VIALALLVALPSLAGGFFADDYTFLVALRHHVRPFFDLFRFATGDPQRTAQLVASGDYPWWSALDFKLHFIRPLTSIFLAGDSALFGNSALAYHLDSLAWYFALLIGAWMFFRRTLAAHSATLALLVFALRSGHTLPFAWIATRHVLIAAVPAVFALLAHMRAEREGWKPGRFVAPLLLVVALSGSEIALGIVPFWIAFDVMQAGTSRSQSAPAGSAEASRGARSRGARRVLEACAPALVITAVYFLSYRLLGGGAVHTPSYRNPLDDPGGFAIGVLQRVPTYLADALVGLPVAVSVDLSAWPVMLTGALGVLLCGALFVATRAAHDDDRATLAWVVPAALLALGPGLSALWGHTLLLPDLGFSALIGSLLWRVIDAVRSQRVQGLAKYGVVAGGAVLVVGHLFVSPLATAQTMWQLIRGGQINARTARSAHLGASPPKRLFLMAAPEARNYFYARDTVETLAPETLACWSVLAATNAPYRFTRDGERSFELEETARPTEEHYDHYFSTRTFAVGDEVQQCGATIRVDALRDGKPSLLHVALDEPLDADDLALVILRDRRFERFPLPAVGGSIDLSNPELVPPPTALRVTSAVVPR